MSRSERPRVSDDGLISGPARLEPSVHALSRRLTTGDIAVIDVLDLDQRAAESLASRKPAAVINVQRSISGRYPNGGPLVLAQAGIPLLDAVGPDVLAIRNGAKIEVRGGAVHQGGDLVAEGTRLSEDDVRTAMAEAAEGMRVQLAAFTANAMDHVDHEGAMILEGVGLPDLPVDMDGRHVVVVAPGYRHHEQLKQIRRYLRDHRPVMIGVGEGADACHAVTGNVSLVVGDVETVAEDALKSADHVLLHDPRGGSGGQARIDALGIAHGHVSSRLGSVDLAILLARARGASVIVTAGVEGTLLEFLETRRPDAAGTFLARLQAGGRLVDAASLSQVYRHRYSAWSLVLLLASGLLALGAAVIATPGGRSWVEGLWSTLTTWLGGA